MVQRIEYAGFPEVREQEMIPFVNKLFGHIQRTAPSSKDLREWLREQSAWDKEAVPVALEFVDVQTKGSKVSLGKWATQMFAIDDAEGQKSHLYKRLYDENTLLCKYVLEALDSEGGGRLHSTHELHRMLTSYVYPGKHLRLTDFQAWIKWAVASGRIKLIGIRWGLTDLGKEAVPRLRGVDVDEFLEDEAAVAAAGDGDDGEGDAAPVAAPTPAAPATPVAAAKAPGRPAAKAADPEPDEEGLDLPPEAPPVDESTFARYVDALQEPTGDAPDAPIAPPLSRSAAATTARADAPAPATTSARAAAAAVPAVAGATGSAGSATPLRNRSTVAPSTWVAQARLEVGCLREPVDAAEAVAQLRELGRQRGVAAGGSSLVALGLEPRMAANEPARHLFLAALLARLYAVRPDGSLAELLVERAGGLGPVAMLYERPETLAEVVVRWALGTPDVAAQQLRAVLLDAVIGGRALAARPDLPTVLTETPQSEMLIGTLQQGLLRGAPATAAFWLVREMVRLGLWTRPSHTDIAAVPTRSMRLLAYRMRWIDSHFSGSTARLLEIARRLAALLPPGSIEAVVAEQLAPDEHLRFDCARLPVCHEPCSLHRED